MTRWMKSTSYHRLVRIKWNVNSHVSDIPIPNKVFWKPEPLPLYCKSSHRSFQSMSIVKLVVLTPSPPRCQNFQLVHPLIATSTATLSASTVFPTPRRSQDSSTGKSLWSQRWRQDCRFNSRSSNPTDYYTHHNGSCGDHAINHPQRDVWSTTVKMALLPREWLWD
jgi:hypothetical protein